MPSFYNRTPTAMDLETTSGDAWELDVSKVDQVRIEAVLESGAWGAAVLTVYHSISGDTALPLDEPVTFTAEGQALIDMRCYRKLVVKVTTDQSGTPGAVILHAFGNSTVIGALGWRVSGVS